eukprot:7719142-Alexandrium_andersonii.AAC.1
MCIRDRHPAGHITSDAPPPGSAVSHGPILHDNPWFMAHVLRMRAPLRNRACGSERRRAHAHMLCP